MLFPDITRCLQYDREGTYESEVCMKMNQLRKDHWIVLPQIKYFIKYIYFSRHFWKLWVVQVGTFKSDISWRIIPFSRCDFSLWWWSRWVQWALLCLPILLTWGPWTWGPLYFEGLEFGGLVFGGLGLGGTRLQWRGAGGFNGHFYDFGSWTWGP